MTTPESGGANLTSCQKTPFWAKIRAQALEKLKIFCIK